MLACVHIRTRAGPRMNRWRVCAACMRVCVVFVCAVRACVPVACMCVCMLCGAVHVHVCMCMCTCLCVPLMTFLGKPKEVKMAHQRWTAVSVFPCPPICDTQPAPPEHRCVRQQVCLCPTAFECIWAGADRQNLSVFKQRIGESCFGATQNFLKTSGPAGWLERGAGGGAGGSHWLPG